MQADGAKPQRLSGGFDFMANHPPSWSPDGRWLAVVGVEDAQEWIAAGQEGRSLSGKGRWALHLISTQSSREFLRLSDAVSGASWSPDGTRIAFAKSEPEENAVALYTIAADGTDLQRVTTITGWHPRFGEPDPTRALIETVAWSPDGSKILYSCNGICVVTPDGSPVGPAPLPGNLAAWSPNGSRIATVNDLLVQTMAPDGSDLRVLVLPALGGLIAAESGYDDLESSQAACAAGHVVDAPAESPGLVRDCGVLIGLRDALFGGRLVNWGPGTPIDQWLGVTVDGAPPRVTALHLRRLDFSGPIPAELGRLTHLEVLDLSVNGPNPGNGLSGLIPAELGALTRLRILDLSLNHLTGPVPPELGRLAHLEVLNLRRNGLTGPIPPELGQLTHLKELRLAFNRLTAIPAELVQLANLRILALGENRLTGCIPPALHRVPDNDLARLELPNCEPA